jgi:hypothetical protein
MHQQLVSIVVTLRGSNGEEISILKSGDELRRDLDQRPGLKLVLWPLVQKYLGAAHGD